MPPATPLLRPGRFFAERGIDGPRTLAVALAVLGSLPLGILGVGYVLRARIDGTVRVDNPNRPSERFCEGMANSMDLGCDEPAQIERNIDAILSEAVGELIGPALIGIVLAVLLIGGALHAGSWLFDGENGVKASFAVAIWGLLPSLISLFVGVLLLFVVLDPITVTPRDDPSVMTERVRADLAPLLRWQPLLSGATTLWSGVVWRAGHVEARGLTSGEATGVAGIVAILTWVLSLV
jgi:hypothetical protein